MAREWETAPLSELCEQIADCPHSTPMWTNSGVIVLRNQNIRGGGLDLSSPSYTDEAHFEQRSRRARLRAGDLVLTREAPMGEVCMVPENLRCCLGQRMVMLRPNPKKCDSRFLLYSIQSDAVQHEIKASEGTGSTVSNLRIPLLEALPIPHPPLAEQKAIAAVLGALDEKIELNRRMNATLEAIVRALFQSWFVDFDPVRARLDGWSATGVDSATAALFPELLEDSPLGHIPKGWKVTNLGEIATNPRRGVQPRDIGPNTSYIALEHMPRRSIALGDWDDSAAVASNKLAFKKGEILFGKLRPYFHKVGVAPLDGVCSTDILVLAPKSPEWFGFLLGHASSEDLIQFTDLASTGTRMPRTSWTDIGSYKVALPPVSIADVFTKSVSPFICRINANLHESRVLAAIRDALLPKLLSGEITL